MKLFCFCLTGSFDVRVRINSVSSSFMNGESHRCLTELTARSSAISSDYNQINDDYV